MKPFLTLRPAGIALAHRTALIGIVLLAAVCTAGALETHTGTVRIPTEVKCLDNCDNYRLDPDTGTTAYFLRGTDLILYVGRHVQIYGYRSYCGGCLVINVTAVVRLPLDDVQLVDDRMPSSARLLQNFPNPFNPATSIRYDIVASGSVRLVVYDMLGREVTTLVDAHQGPGSYEVSWNASEVPSGMYVYRLQTGGESFMMKMIVAK